MDRKNSRPLYVMDDEYIENKYVKAEEERLRQLEVERLRKEREDAAALVEIEKQRKVAEAERARQAEEQQKIDQLRRLKEQREARERLRKEKEDEYQTKLNAIQKSIDILDQERSTMVENRLKVATEMRNEEDQIRRQLEEIVREKNAILEREQAQKLKLRNYEEKTNNDLEILKQKEVEVNQKIHNLTNDRRKLQNDLLQLLQNQTAEPEMQAPQGNPSGVNVGNNPVQPQANSYGNGGMMYYNTGGQNQGAQTGGMYNGGYPNLQTQPVNPPQPRAQTPPVGQSSQPAQHTSGGNDLNEQLRLLDDFLNQGILSPAEYEEQKKAIIAASGAAGMQSANAPVVSAQHSYATQANAEASVAIVNPTPAPAPAPAQSNPSQSSINQQIAQLDQFLREGVLTPAEYDDAKQKVLADAGLTQPNATQGNTHQPSAPPASQTTVQVTVPAGMQPGQAMNIQVQGKLFAVTVPPNMYPGMTFHANVPL